jgi:hypothetical protein
MMVLRLVCFLGLALSVGCGTKTPARVEAPSWDPEGFADAILEKQDANSDGSLDTAELATAPGLAFGAKFIDTDGNKLLSRDELVARFERYVERRLGLTTKTMQLSYKQRPVSGAKIRLVPEFFLTDVVEPATAETMPDGTFDPLTEGVELPGVRVGYYKVVVESSPKVKLPAKLSSADTTNLGVEISPFSDDLETYGTIKLNVKE